MICNDLYDGAETCDLVGLFLLSGFSIKVEANHKIVNYLDITLNLETGLFKPYSTCYETWNKYFHHETHQQYPSS